MAYNPSGKRNAIDAYLSALPKDKQAALETLRANIRAIAPEAEECIYYNLPAFRLAGKPLVAFGAAKLHCSLYPLSAATIEAHEPLLRGYDLSRGTIRFPVERPLPLPLLRKIIEARMADIAGSREKQRRTRPATKRNSAAKARTRKSQFLFIISHDESFRPTKKLFRDIAAWIEAAEARGARVYGNPLRPPCDATTVRVRNGAVHLTEGPFAQSKEKMCAYELVACASMDEAIELAAEHPMAKAATIEIRPVWSELAG